MEILKIKVRFGDSGKILIELNINKKLNEIRKDLINFIDFPFIFLDADEDAIQKEKESEIILKDILDGKNLYLKKERKNRVMLGTKLENKNGLEFYVYPKINLTNEEKDHSLNIMVFGESGTGKSTWLHCLLNYIQDIQLEENKRYYLFDEKSIEEKYEKIHGKSFGGGITNEAAIYNIKETNIFKNPIRLIDTSGVLDCRVPEWDKKILEDIENLFLSPEIESVNAICLFLKQETERFRDNLLLKITKLFNLFGKDIKNNFIIIFTFCDNYEEKERPNILKRRNNSFYEVFCDINELPCYFFDNRGYFADDKDIVEKIFEENKKNFRGLLKYIFKLKRIPLDSTEKNVNNKMLIKNSIYNLFDKLYNIILVLETISQNIIRLISLLNEVEGYISSQKNIIQYTFQEHFEEIVNKEIKCDSGWYVLYCNYCNKVCHKKCKGMIEGWHSYSKGCFIISENDKCFDCKCGEFKHKYKDSYIVKEKIIKTKEVIKYKIDEEKFHSKEEKKKITDILIEEKENINRKLIELNKFFQDSIIEGMDCLYQIALKNDELNNLGKKNEVEKYEFVKEVFKENLENKINKQIFNIFYSILEDIDNIFNNKQIRDETINKIKESLLSLK